MTGGWSTATAERGAKHLLPPENLTGSSQISSCQTSGNRTGIAAWAKFLAGDVTLSRFKV